MGGDIQASNLELRLAAAESRRVLPPTFGGLRGGMQIFVKKLNGKTITISDIGAADTTETLKTKIRVKLHMVSTQNTDFYLVFGGRRLQSNNDLFHYNINSGNTVWMLMRLRGGMDAEAALLATKNIDFLQVF